MEFTHIIAFNATLLAAILSPGPAMLMSIRASLSGGFRQGFTVGLGLAVMAATWTALALLGLDGIFTLFPWAYLTLKIAGALYLIWIAVQTWRNARKPLNPEGVAARQGKSFLSGLSVNLANPKSVLFASAVLLVIFPQDITLADKAFVVLNHLIVEIICYAGFALLLSTPAARDSYLRAKTVMDRVAAGVMGALGVRLLLDR
ncbi:LysE family translocator [Cognatishimia activa]|uniref:LysE family translocator n=1 Tax=Cognatishimia activa TaxID=1715691 RepID=A0A975ENY8_9RHOB|nr:LysE family translocator [Cognatishimia activa]QTN35464.1 LysE family translocator [Cognatishimia activa]